MYIHVLLFIHSYIIYVRISVYIYTQIHNIESTEDPTFLDVPALVRPQDTASAWLVLSQMHGSQAMRN